MTPEIIAALVNMGSAGAVIVVVLIFNKSNEKRDAEWRDFFTELNRSNREDVAGMAQDLKDTIKCLDSHDKRSQEIYTVVNKILAIIDRPTRRSVHD